MDKATGWLGSRPYGPVCWRRMFPVEKKITAKVVKNDQPDLFEVENDIRPILDSLARQ